MIYLQRSSQNRQKNKTRRAIVLGITLVVVIFLSRFFFPTFIGNAIDHASEPLWKADSKLGGLFLKTSMFFRSRSNIIDENRQLKEMLQAQSSKIAFSQILEREYENLQATYGRNEIRNKILAGVLVGPPETPYDTLVIDTGTRNNVALGDVVITEGNIALGTVAETRDSTSKVTLFSSPGEQVRVFIERSTTSVTLTGRGGGSFEAELPQDVDVITGDILVFPGTVPLAVGTVVEVDADVQSAFKKVLVQGEINFSNLRFVEVLGGSALEEDRL